MNRPPRTQYGGEKDEPVKYMVSRILSKNVNGLQSAERYSRFLRAINAEDHKNGVSAVLVQEHNLRPDQGVRHHAIARRLRILAFIAYMPDDDYKGGTAIFIPYDRVERRKVGKSPESEDTALGRVGATARYAAAGRITRVTTDLGDTPIQLTSVYAHAKGGTLVNCARLA